MSMRRPSARPRAPPLSQHGARVAWTMHGAVRRAGDAGRVGVRASTQGTIAA